MDKKYAEYLLERTKKDYNLLAEDYARTRAFVPEDIKALCSHTLERERVLDSGCANGRIYGVLKDKNIDYFGIDFSEKLIEIAKKDYPQAKFQTVSALGLPFPSNFFDKIYSISVLHNIPSKELQIQYLKEANRVLKPGGFLIFRIWDFWRRKEGWRLFFKYAFLKIIGKSKLDFCDVFVPWKNSQGEILRQRYFHCFTKKELENLIRQAGFKMKKIWRAGKDPRTNIYLIAEK